MYVDEILRFHFLTNFLKILFVIWSWTLTFLWNFVAIAIYKPEDVRPILDAYRDKDIPIEYAKKEAEAKQLHIEEWIRKGKQSGGLTLSSLFGGSASPVRILYSTHEKSRFVSHTRLLLPL